MPPSGTRLKLKKKQTLPDPQIPWNPRPPDLQTHPCNSRLADAVYLANLGTHGNVHHLSVLHGWLLGLRWHAAFRASPGLPYRAKNGSYRAKNHETYGKN